MRGREKKEGGDWFRTFRSIRGKMQRAKKKKRLNVTIGLRLANTSYLYLLFFFKC
jgi:hypothetical protein